MAADALVVENLRFSIYDCIWGFAVATMPSPSCVARELTDFGRAVGRYDGEGAIATAHPLATACAVRFVRGICRYDISVWIQNYHPPVYRLPTTIYHLPTTNSITNHRADIQPHPASLRHFSS